MYVVVKFIGHFGYPFAGSLRQEKRKKENTFYINVCWSKIYWSFWISFCWQFKTRKKIKVKRKKKRIYKMNVFMGKFIYHIFYS
jgi:hypothetical protein